MSIKRVTYVPNANDVPLVLAIPPGPEPGDVLITDRAFIYSEAGVWEPLEAPLTIQPDSQ